VQFAQKEKLILRNENGFGSIVKLSGARRKPYGVRITTGWKDGKQVRKYLGYYKTQHEALVALAEYHKNGVDLDVSKLTLGEVYDQWIKRKEQTISVSALRIHNMAYVRFGKMKDMEMREIKKIHLQKWLDAIDLKPGSKARLRSTMFQLFDYAVSYDIVQKNYAKDLEIPEKVEKTGAVFTEEEIAKLWEHRDDKMARYILILIYTGMRIGEMLAITGDNLHLEERYMIGGNKTEAGKDRIIPIHEKIVPLIEQNFENNYLVYSNRGGAFTYPGIKPHFNKLMAKLGMKHKIHDTRKTAVSIMHSAGIPMETVRIIIGHSAQGVTESVYLYKSSQELVDTVNMIEIPY
jgi:integrase